MVSRITKTFFVSLFLILLVIIGLTFYFPTQETSIIPKIPSEIIESGKFGSVKNCDSQFFEGFAGYRVLGIQEGAGNPRGIELFKDGVLIKEDLNLVNDGLIKITTSPYGSSQDLCEFEADPTSLKNKIKISVVMDNYFQNRNDNVIKVKINNDAHVFTEKLYVFYTQKLLETQEVLYEDIKNVIVIKGENIYEVFIPKEFLIGAYSVKLFVGSEHNLIGGDLRASNKIIALTDIIDRNFIINPPPVWIEKEPSEQCPNDYVLAPESKTLCTRKDLKTTSCLVLSCPISTTRVYECTSAGVCSETLLKQQDCKSDLDCRSDERCDIPTGTCLNSKIYNRLFECKTASDCPFIAKGITSVCDGTNQCKYLGEVTPDVIIKDCNDIGCSVEDAVCNKKTGVCELTTEKIVETTTIIEVPDEPPIIEPPKKSFFEKYWIWILGSALFVIIGSLISYFFLFKKNLKYSSKKRNV